MGAPKTIDQVDGDTTAEKTSGIPYAPLDPWKPSHPTLGQQDITVLIMKIGDVRPTDAELVQQVETGLAALAARIDRESFGKASLTFRVLGPMATTDAICLGDSSPNENAVVHEAIRLFDPQVDFAQTRQLFVLPYVAEGATRFRCKFATQGWKDLLSRAHPLQSDEGQLAGSMVLADLATPNLSGTLLHEYGHPRSASHLQAWRCTDDTGQRIPLAHDWLEFVCSISWHGVLGAYFPPDPRRRSSSRQDDWQLPTRRRRDGRDANQRPPRALEARRLCPARQRCRVSGRGRAHFERRSHRAWRLPLCGCELSSAAGSVWNVFDLVCRAAAASESDDNRAPCVADRHPIRRRRSRHHDRSRAARRRRDRCAVRRRNRPTWSVDKRRLDLPNCNSPTAAVSSVVTRFLAVVVWCGGALAACGGSPDQGARDLAPALPAADPTGWRTTNALSVERSNHTATLLTDGRVLIVGGNTWKGAPLASIELFDPQTESWSLGPALPEPRTNHSAARLPDGRVLIFGGGLSTPIGVPSGEGVMATTLFFDPTTNALAPGPSMVAARSYVQTANLADGSVLAIGGGSDESEELIDCKNGTYCGPFARALATVERFDPQTGTWSAIGAMATGRYLFAVSPLLDGGVIAVGGVDAQGSGFRSTERLSTTTWTWSAGPQLLGAPRIYHDAATSGTGMVLVVGGKNPNVKPLDTAQRLPASGVEWSYTPKLTAARTATRLLTLESGRILMVGGYNQYDAGLETAFLTEAAIYDDAANAWSPIEPLVEGRFGHTVTRLANGRVLVVGGSGNAGALSSCEISK